MDLHKRAIVIFVNKFTLPFFFSSLFHMNFFLL